MSDFVCTTMGNNGASWGNNIYLAGQGRYQQCLYSPDEGRRIRVYQYVGGIVQIIELLFSGYCRVSSRYR